MASTHERHQKLSLMKRRRPRADYGKPQKTPGIPEVATPPLLEIQTISYDVFLQFKVPAAKRADRGFQSAFKSVFPIVGYSGYAILEFVEYQLGTPAFDVKECQMRGLTYAAPLRVKIRLVIY